MSPLRSPRYDTRNTHPNQAPPRSPHPPQAPCTRTPCCRPSPSSPGYTATAATSPPPPPLRNSRCPAGLLLGPTAAPPFRALGFLTVPPPHTRPRPARMASAKRLLLHAPILAPLIAISIWSFPEPISTTASVQKVR